MTSYIHTLLALPFIQQFFVHVLQSTNYGSHIQIFSSTKSNVWLEIWNKDENQL